MKLKTKNPYQDLCIWLGVILDESPKESVIQWFNDQFDVRITEVEEIQSLYVFGDGSFRNDIIFKIHKDDVSTFAFPRLSTDIKWWVDIPDETCHPFRNKPATCSGFILPPIPV